MQIRFLSIFPSVAARHHHLSNPQTDTSSKGPNFQFIRWLVLVFSRWESIACASHSTLYACTPLCMAACTYFCASFNNFVSGYLWPVLNKIKGILSCMCTAIDRDREKKSNDSLTTSTTTTQ